MNNKVIILGRLVRPPEVRTTQAGKIVTEFTLAVNRPGKDQPADFVSVIAWEKLGDACGNYLDKGLRALVEGRLQTRSYEDKEGKKRYVTEVIAQTVEFLDRRAQGSEAAPPITDAGQFGADVAPDDSIPF